MTKAPIDVLFITGLGRSGSTLLSRLLGAIAGVDNLGEFASYWTVPSLFSRNLPCGCGQSMEACVRWGKWGDVGQIATDGESRRLFNNLTVFRRGRATEKARRRLGEDLGRRYSRAALETGARLLVDASKRPAVAMAIAAASNVNVYIAHLVRDPQAVAASRAQPKDYLDQIPAWHIGPRWSAVNLAAERVGGTAPGYTLIRYEDLVNKPQESLKQILDELSITGFDAPNFVNGRLDVGVQHSIAGNPDKLGDTVITIRKVAETRPRIRGAILVALTTAPVRKRYGY